MEEMEAGGDELSADKVLLEYLRGRSMEARRRFAEALLRPQQAEAAAPPTEMGDADMEELAALVGGEEEKSGEYEMEG